MLTCPKCLLPITDFIEQMKQLEEMWEGAVLDPEFPIYANIFCPHCEEPTVCMFVEPSELVDIVTDPQGQNILVHGPVQKKKVKN